MRVWIILFIFCAAPAGAQSGWPELIDPSGSDRGRLESRILRDLTRQSALEALRRAEPEEVGLTGRPLDRATAAAWNLPAPEGVLITAIDPQGGFGRRGFRPGDVIVGVEGRPVASVGDIAAIIALAPAPEVVVDYLRDGQRGSTMVDMQPPPLPAPRIDPPRPDPPRARTSASEPPRRPATAEPPARPPPAPASTAETERDLRLLRVDRAVIERYNLPPAASGVLVLATGAEGEGIGLQEGDVIALINGTRVESEAMVRAVLSRPGRYRFSVIRGRERVVLVHTV